MLEHRPACYVLCMQGQVVSADAVRSEANNYATTKSVTQVIFTTSAIASNVTLWNQVGECPNQNRFCTTVHAGGPKHEVMSV